jgi:hypothetical protein
MFSGSFDLSRINETFDQLGPTPRLCLEVASEVNGYHQYKTHLARVIEQITTAQIKQLFNEANDLSMDAISHYICLVRRKWQENVCSDSVIAPMTPSIQSRLANHFRNLERDEQLDLYRYFARVPDSRATAGIFFEAIAQRQFQENILLELVPMVKLGQGRKKTLPQWYSSHVFLSNPALETSRQQALQQCVIIDTKPFRTEEFTEDGPASIEPNVLYIPEAMNHAALDSFILINGLLIIFQFTIGLKHGIKPLRFFGQYPTLPAMSMWRFVFVIPPNLRVVCPQQWSLDLRTLPMYSAVVTSSWVLPYQ